MFGDESMFCTEVFWCGTDHLPEIDPAGLPFLGSPPPALGNQKIGTATISEPKKECLFSFKLLIINDINQYFNIHLYLIGFIIYNR